MARTKFRDKDSPLTGGKRVHPKVSEELAKLADSTSEEFQAQAVRAFRGASDSRLGKVEESLKPKREAEESRTLDLSNRGTAAEVMEALISAEGGEVGPEPLNYSATSGGALQNTDGGLIKEVEAELRVQLFTSREEEVTNANYPGKPFTRVWITQNPAVVIEREGAAGEKKYKLTLK